MRIPAKVWAEWQMTAEAEGCNRVEFVRRAISLAVWFFAGHRGGRKIYVYEPPSGPLALLDWRRYREVVFQWDTEG